MAKMKGAIVVDTERCKGCQLCIIACPQKVIALANKVNLHGYTDVSPCIVKKWRNKLWQKTRKLC